MPARGQGVLRERRDHAVTDNSMVEWLRSQILARKAVAEAATKGEWDSDDGGSIHVGHPTHVVVDWIVNDEDLAHVLLQQPQDTIDRCDADLAILDRVVPAVHRSEVVVAEEFGGLWPEGEPTRVETLLVRLLAFGYRRRPGWNPDWAPEGAAL